MQNICVQGIYRPANKREMCSITPQSDSYHKVSSMGLLIVESYGLEIVSLFHTYQFCYMLQSAWLVIVYTPLIYVVNHITLLIVTNICMSLLVISYHYSVA